MIFKVEGVCEVELRHLANVFDVVGTGSLKNQLLHLGKVVPILALFSFWVNFSFFLVLDELNGTKKFLLTLFLQARLAELGMRPYDAHLIIVLFQLLKLWVLLRRQIDALFFLFLSVGDATLYLKVLLRDPRILAFFIIAKYTVAAAS